jgi:hypothetical protein
LKESFTLTQEQYGVRTKSSTNVATYKLINNILLALNSKSLMDRLFCDLTKAFDSVNHDVLLIKLGSMVVRALWDC